MRTLNAGGMTVVLTTHNMEEAEYLCHRLAILDHGKLIAEGTPAELIARWAPDPPQQPRHGNLVTFPQMFLSGIFYPIDILPAWLQPVAELLPLSFLATALRELMVDGAAAAALLPQFAGLVAWNGICLFLAVRLFRWKEVAA